MKATYEILGSMVSGYYAAIRIRHGLLSSRYPTLTHDVESESTARKHAIKVLEDLGITDYKEIK